MIRPSLKFISQIASWIFHAVQIILYPSDCKICLNSLAFKHERIICSDCREKIVMNRKPVCKQCGCIMENDAELCGSCIIKPPHFRKHVTYGAYRGVLKKTILIYKYGRVRKLKHLFTELFLELFRETIDEPFDFILSVPPDSGRRRGYSPVGEITRLLSKELNIPELSNHLIKIKKTAPQAGLGKESRMKNLDGAFELRNGRNIEGKKILLIDDVYTTGTTIARCTELLAANRADVVVMTLART